LEVNNLQIYKDVNNRVAIDMKIEFEKSGKLKTEKLWIESEAKHSPKIFGAKKPIKRHKLQEKNQVSVVFIK